MQQSGEESPLDIYPKLDQFETTVCNRFIQISRMRSGEGLITAQDYLASFQLFGMEDSYKPLLPIFLLVDVEVTSFSQEQREKKREAKANMAKSKN